MYVPRARDYVEIDGRPGLFMVLWVNLEDERADLLALRKNAYALSDIPFAKLRPCQEDAP
jgi:hypothetical protein